MRLTSIILLAVLLVTMPSCKYFKGGRKSREYAIMKARADSMRYADSVQKVIDLRMEASLDSARRAEEARLVMESQHRYNIIVGSFLTPEYARILTEEYKRNGYNPEIIKLEGGRFELVAIEAFDNYKNAVDRLKQYQDTVQFESWLYIRK
jgi:uncharacterized Ntn-hydrolase superfamily protein